MKPSPKSLIIAGLYLLNQDDSGDNAMMTLDRERDNGVLSRMFWADMDVNGTEVVEEFDNTAEINATVRFRWEASGQRLHYEYDGDGAANGYTWTSLTSKPLNQGDTHWEMNSTSSFAIALIAGGEHITITQANDVWLDNFKIEGTPGRQ